MRDHVDALIGGQATPSQAIEDLVRRLDALEERLRLGRGTPEGVVKAGPGVLYQDIRPGGPGTLYRKSTGTGRTGWVTVP